MVAAAKLNKLAPVKLDLDLLCDGPTYAKAKIGIVFQTLPPITVKGNPVPISIYMPKRCISKDEANHRSLIELQVKPFK
jgi:hypothetical protein